MCKLLEEMYVIEQFLIEHVFKDTEYGQLLNTTMEVENDKARRTWKKYGGQSEDKRKL